MDKLIKYLKDKLHLSDDLIKVVLENIKVKYVVPTYYFGDLSFTDINVLIDEDDEEFYNNVEDLNDWDFKHLIISIIKDKGLNNIPNIATSKFKNVKEGDEYWAIYYDKPPMNVVVTQVLDTLKLNYSGTYNDIIFLNKANNKTFSIHNAGACDNSLDLFLTRDEAVKFYRDKFDLN